MKNKVYASTVFSGIIVLLIISAFFAILPQQADAATFSEQMRSRLCDRQDRLGGRLIRALIDPALCGETPTPKPVVTIDADPSSIDEGESSTLTWSATNATSCTASDGWSGLKATSGSTSVSPSETTDYTLTCTGPGGSDSETTTVEVEDTPVPTPTLEFSANPMSILSGATSTLSWDSDDATRCVASNGWTGDKSLDGTAPVSPTATTTYTLACGNGTSTSTESVTVNVSTSPTPTPSITFTADPTSVIANGTSTLTWSTSNVTFCTASNAWTGEKSTSGTQPVTPSATSTYALSCGGQYGTTSTSVTVNVTPAASPTPTVTLTADPTTVTGDSAGNATTTLTWTSTNAVSCTAFGGGWSGLKATSSSEVVTPSATTTYQLDCTGPGGGVGSDDAVVNFVPAATSTPSPTLTFSASRTTVTPGAGSATSTLTWSSANASSCVASNGWTGATTTSGSLVVQPNATTTYALLCGNGIASTSESVTVNFVPAASPTIGHVVISEVLYNATAPESDNEWIELYNGTDATVDLEGWDIGDTNATSTISGISIEAGGFEIIAATTTLTGIPAGVPVFVVSDIGNNLANGGDAAILYDSSGTVVDQVGWGTEDTVTPVVTPIAGDGDSIARDQLTSDTDTSADWEVLATPTPGQ